MIWRPFCSVVFVRKLFVVSPPPRSRCSPTVFVPCKQIYLSRFFKNMPFYAVIFRKTKSGTVAESWDVARELRDAARNSFAKKFSSKVDAEKYITDFNFKIVQTAKNTGNSGKKNKIVRLETLNNPICSVNDHVKKIKLAFSDLQTAVASLPELSKTCVRQVRTLNKEVCDKLDEIFNVVEIEPQNISLVVPSTSSSKRNLALSGKKKLFSTSNYDAIDGNLSPSKLETGKKLFTLNKKKEVIVFTDGACIKNGTVYASAGAGIWFGNSHPLNLSVKVPGKQTNNNAEIYSIIKAIDIVKATGLSRICIQTDSEFVIKSINEWLPQWVTNGWKTSRGDDVKNKELFMQLHNNIKSMDSVSWIHVPGHKGITGNEEADKLARLGVNM